MKWVVDTKTNTVYEYIKFAPFSKTGELSQDYYHFLKAMNGMARVVKPDVFAAHFVELEKKPKNNKKVKKTT